MSIFKKHQLYINGKWCDAQTTFSVVNPATLTTLADVADATEADVLNAIDAADKAFADWKNISFRERNRLLRKWFDLIIKHQEELAALITQESGKPIAEAKSEVLYGASYIEWFAEEGKRIYGDIIPSENNKSMRVIKQPVGVVAMITPWNFPLAMLARKMAPALATGCTLIAKPAAETPLTTLALFELAEQAGFPAGVINCITATQSELVGKIFTSDNRIRKISFTGSTAVGKKLIAQSADDIKRLSMELGGNAPFIVFDDADLDAAVSGAMQSKFRNAGQTCVCANRFYIHASIEKQFTEKLTTAISKLIIGNGMSPDTTLGPLISEKAIRKVQGLVDTALTKGANIVYQYRLDRTRLQGYFFAPIILNNLDFDSPVLCEEIFGPVVSICTFDSEDQLLHHINKTEYGLSAYLYTQNAARIHRLSQSIQTGMLGINTGIISNEMAPFGGIKHSGWGREGSRYGVDDYLSLKYICQVF